jgi:hypothetical protein
MRSPGGAPAVRAVAPSKVREVGASPCEWGDGGRRKWPEAATFISGRSVRWSSVAGGGPCSSGEERGK